MKMSLLKRMVKGSGISAIACSVAIAATPGIAQLEPAAEETTFFCGAIAETPATIARTPSGEIPIVMWDSDRFPDAADLQQQCEEVSQRFQTYYDNGSLNYITSGMMDGELVACVADGEDQGCKGMLFPLNTDSNPRGSLQQIFRIRVASAGPISETGDRLYIDLDKYLNGEYPSLLPVGTNFRWIPPEETPEVLPEEENL